MSSIERNSGLLLFALVALAYGQQPKPETAVTCPASITTTESAGPLPGWSVSPSKSQRSFERISVYNGRPGGTEYDLAPDDEKKQGNKIVQTWMLKGYRTMNIFVRCRYHDTSVVLWRDLPPEVETCTLRFTLDNKGRIADGSSMDCR